VTQVANVLPRIHCRESDPTPKKCAPPLWGRRTNPGKPKHDLFTMAKDRIGGMTWAQVAEKHGIKGNPSGIARSGERDAAGHMARMLVLNSSRVIVQLKPHEAAALDGVRDS
jgi:hypothetical protein